MIRGISGSARGLVKDREVGRPCLGVLNERGLQTSRASTEQSGDRAGGGACGRQAGPVGAGPGALGSLRTHCAPFV